MEGSGDGEAGSTPGPGGATAAVADLLAGLGRGERPAPEVVAGALQRAEAEDPRGLRRLLEEALGVASTAATLADLLPPRGRDRLLRFLRPGAAVGRLVEAVDLLAAAARAFTGPVDPGARWGFLVGYLVAEGRLPEAGRVAGPFLTFLEDTGAWSGPRGGLVRAVRSRLSGADTPGDPALVRILLDGTAGDSLPTEARPARPVEEESGDEDVFVTNAGLVLVAPFLARLFTKLGLTEGRAFRDDEAAERAAHLLQHLVEERADRPEHLLVLNRVLCGVPPGRPLPRSIVVGPEEDEAIRGLLAAVVEHWGALGNTSIQGLRESFLQREGLLGRVDGAWRLQVEERAFDVLLDRIPWSFRTVRLPWMEALLHVEWR